MDDAIRSPRRGHIRAIVVYPINALANSQAGELEKYLCRGFAEPLEGLLAHPVARWLEGAAGVRPEPGGRLVRATPKRLGDAGLVADLAEASGAKAEWCGEALEAILRAASRTPRADGRPLFGLRLHQFISKGDTVHASLEAEPERHVTLRAQRFVPGSDRQKVLRPLAFCDDVSYVMDTFPFVKRRDEAEHGYPPPADPRVAHPPRGLSPQRGDNLTERAG